MIALLSFSQNGHLNPLERDAAIFLDAGPDKTLIGNCGTPPAAPPRELGQRPPSEAVRMAQALIAAEKMHVPTISSPMISEYETLAVVVHDEGMWQAY